MRFLRPFILALLLLLQAFPVWSSDFGFNFRATFPFVIDGANESAVLAEQFPHSYSNGASAGWNTGISQSRDRAVIDRRMSGVNWGAVNDTFTVTLDAAESKDIRLALGDQANARTNLKFELYDNTTLFQTIGPVSPGANQYYDATAVLRTSDSDWATNNAALTRVFTTTTFIVKATGASAGDNTIAHLRVTTTPGGASAPTRSLTGVGQ